jgi:hypothetical protein
MALYRIFTEDKNQQDIEAIIARRFPGFTIYKADGYWRLQKEHTLIIEIIAEDIEAQLQDIATDIKLANSQEAVLVQKMENNQWLL